MKLVYSFLAVLFVSGTALACPNLSGEWTCVGRDSEKANVKFTSITKEDISLLLITSDEGTKVQTSDTLVLDGGKQKTKDYQYSASCSDNSVVINLETVFGKAKVVYSKISPNELLVSSLNEYEVGPKVMACEKLSALD